MGKCITDQLTSHAQAVRHLDRMVPEAMKVLEAMLKDESKAARQWACEIIIKKAFPDKQEIKDTTGEKPVLYTAIKQYVNGEKVG